MLCSSHTEYRTVNAPRLTSPHLGHWMVVSHKALLDPDFLTAALLEALPEMADLPGVASYLVQDLLIPEGPAVWETAESLDNILGAHLLDLSVCESPLQAQLACEDLQRACQHPNDCHTRLCNHLKQGKSLREALDASHSPENEDELPPGACALCQRQMPLTWHHLYPQDVHKKFLKRGLMTQQDCVQGIRVCRQCHNTIHRSFDNETLAAQLHSLESILEQEVIQKWVAYAHKQKARALVGHRVAR